MRRALALILVLGAAAPASAADLMVVGRTETLVAPRAASVKGAKVRVEGRRCTLPGRTPLAALARTKLPLVLEDFGACGRPADAAGLYVRSLAGEKERGADGWVYKVGDETPGIGAADLAGRFGARDDVLWFWCRNGSTGCQRTLSVAPARRAVTAGETLSVRVRAYDDRGDAVPAAGARVTLGPATARAGADGVAELTAPDDAGPLDVVATKRGLVRSFPAEVTVR